MASPRVVFDTNVLVSALSCYGVARLTNVFY